MITPGRLLLLLLAAASLLVDLALVANIGSPDPSSARVGCLLGLLLGQIGLLASLWVKRPEAWPCWLPITFAGIATGSVLLASLGKVPLLHWTILLSIFATLCVALPTIYRIGHGEAKSQFSLSAIFALTTVATLICYVVLHSDFPWEQLPIALPGLMVWSSPAMVIGLTLVDHRHGSRRQLATGLGAILAISVAAAFLLPDLWNRLPLVIAWESIYLMIAGSVVLQARDNDTAEILPKATLSEDV
ncbi:hypothetical protein [Blastopirellula marina]|uniref:hypothetical protein n=1 Tax=Blastopirellula marina TaxID=124 RepID=UPI0011AFE83C|nr:hypothetical protein [Blastopirellula marina]